MVKILNKTDHVIALWINNQWQTIFPQGFAARLVVDKQPVDLHKDLSIKTYNIKEIKYLPNQEHDTIIIVEPDVAKHIWKTIYREDIFCLDNPVVRDDKYNSLASMSLLCYNHIPVQYCL